MAPPAVDGNTLVYDPKNAGDVSAEALYIGFTQKPYGTGKGQRKYSDPFEREWSRIVREEVVYSGLRLSIVGGQMWTETGAHEFGNQVLPAQNNWAGLGATDIVPGKPVERGLSFGPEADDPLGIRHGIRAVIAHWGLYWFGELDRWPSHWDRYKPYAYRHWAVKAAKYLGIIKRLSDLGSGRWGTDSPYWPKVMNRANQLLAIEAGLPKGGGPMGAKNPLARLTDELATYADGHKLLKWDAPNWGHALMWDEVPGFITIHEVGNLKPGANARATANYVLNGGGGGTAENPDPENGVSFHGTVDEHRTIQIAPWNWALHHAGDAGLDLDKDGRKATGMFKAIAIETVQIGDFGATLRRLVKLVAALMREFDIPLSNVVQHNFWSGKNCPQYIRSGKAPNGTPCWNWAQLKEQIAFERRKLDAIDVPVIDVPGAISGAIGGPQTAKAHINAKGETILTINLGGRAKKVLGFVVPDAGATILNDAGEVWDGSLKVDRFTWNKRT